MRKGRKYVLLATMAIISGLAVFGLARYNVFAASTPSLGAATSYGVLATTYTNTAVGTTINGDVGFTVGPTVEPDPVGGHTNYGSGAPYATAGTDQNSALSALNTQGCTTTFPTAVDLFLDATHGTPGVYNPGVYCSIGAMSASGSITLSGSGTYIFRSVGALNTTAGITINLADGASACDVFWTPSGDTTLGANTAFKGTVIQNGDITIGANVVWLGRALAFNGAVASGANSSITVPTCTPPPATLHVVKQVINNGGGVAIASSFNLHVKSSGTDVSGSPAPGAASPGTSYSLAAGTYTISEDANTAYTQSFSGDCNSVGSITLASGEDKTCTITNDDAPATLHIIKTVVNDNGGTATASSFNLHVKLSGADITGSPAAGAGSPGAAYSLAAGTYTVSEDTSSSYAQAFAGDCGSDGNVTLTPGSDKTCTVTNNDIPATITVVKVVVNDNNQTKSIADFPLFVSNVPVTSGMATVFSAPGSYIVSEANDANYARTFSGDCDSSGNVSLNLGDTKVCTIMNDDTGVPIIIPSVPPLIAVVKVPNPLTLPSGPGLVNYAYTLHNIGTVTATDITMVDDSCSPLVYASGDVNANMQFEIGETWAYTCQVNLNTTHTNTVVATGVANGIIATDTASATTVVSSSATPPLIHVTNVPNVSTLITGGLVTYTQNVTNPGTTPLSNVIVTNDAFPLSYLSGDTNNDSKLDSTETWIYTGQISLTKTTTTTTIVTDEANGLQARDFAFATVVVATGFPRLPNAGRRITPPQTVRITWSILSVVGAIIILPLFYLVRKWLMTRN